MTLEASSAYIHGTANDEQQRLRLMNQILNDASLRELAPQRGEKVIEFGGGLGEFARIVARVTGVPVVAIERSAEQIAKARQLAAGAGEESFVEIREGDVYAPPLNASERASFDCAHARFLLEHLNDPQRAVDEMVKAVRPGGRIVLEDDDHDLLRLWPEPPGVMTLWTAYMRSYERLGNDPYTGRRLVEFLYRAGAQPKRNTQLFFGSCAGNPTFDALVDNVTGILEGARSTVVCLGLIDDAYALAALDSLRAWRHRPDAAFWYTMSWAEGVKRE